LSVATYPAGVTSTGENIGTAAGNDGAINGILAINTNSGSLANANFGITATMSVTAGCDFAICSSAGTYTLNTALASNYTSLVWTTNGTGLFSDATIQNPVYTPSTADIATGEVQLTLSATGIGSVSSLSDMMVLTIWPAATAYAGPNAAICSGNSFVLTGATAAHYSTISWTSTGGTFDNANALNPTFTPATVGPVTITLTATGLGSGLCSDAVSSMTLTVKTPIVTATPVVTNANCQGGLTGSVQLGVTSGGTAPYTYTLSIGQSNTTGLFTGLSSGGYTYTVTDAAACSATGSFQVTDPNLLTLAITSQTNETCYPANNGAASVTASGGTEPYRFAWSGTVTQASTSANPNEVTGLSAGTYVVTVTDAKGCTAVQTITITQPALLTQQLVSKTDVSCKGGANGVIVMAATGGTAPYTFSSAGLTFAGNTATSVSNGIYPITVTDANGCNAASTLSVTVNEPLITLSGSATVVNVLCKGSATGSATVIAANGTSPYTYLWSNGSTDQTATALAPGTYSVLITDKNGCTTTVNSIVISEPSTALSASITASANPSCEGSTTGTATVTAAGGTGAYTYLWSNGQTTPTATGLTAGTHSVTVTDVNGCTTQKTILLNDPTGVSAMISASINVTCYGGANGSATVTATGGAGTYNYLWSASAGSQTGATATNLPAGQHTVTVTGTGGCTAQAMVTITQPDVLIAEIISSSNINCKGGANGTATVNATGGTTPYTYLWPASAASQTTATATALAFGTYVVTVTDKNGCQKTASVTITEPSVTLSGSATVVDVLCKGSATGSATVTAANGTAPYTYLWSNGSTDKRATGLVAGTYSVLVTDKNGCTFTISSITISEPATALTAVITSSTHPSCQGSTSGSATVTAGGGTGTYSYLWSNGQTTATATGLTAGTHSVTVTDANGCSKSVTVLLNDPTGVVARISASTNVNCNGGTNGSATVTATGGAGTYNYLWSASAGSQTTATAINLKAGQHTVTVTGTGGCTALAMVTITQPDPLNAVLISQSNISCKGGANGSIVVGATGGAAPYVFTSTGGTVSGNTISGLAASPTPYTLTVTDANHCTANLNITITEPANALSAAITSSSNVICYGSATGSATVTASNGTAPFTYLWSNGSTDQTAAGLIAGTYSVTVTDKNGCSVTLSNAVMITQPAGTVTVNAGPDMTICSSSAMVSLTGTSASNALSYLWTTSGTGTFTNPTSLTSANYTPSQADIAAGLVQLTLTAKSTGNCETVSDFRVLNIWPPPLSDAGPATAAVCAGSSYILTGAVASNYSSLTWSSNSGGTFNNINALNPTYIPATGFTGTVRLTLTAGKLGNSCSDAIDYIDLTVNAIPVLTVNSITNTMCGNSIGSVMLTGSVAGTVMLNGISKPSPATFTGLAAGYFTATFTAANGTACTATASFQITNASSDLSGNVTVKSATCNLATGSVTVNATGGTKTGGSVTATEGYRYALDSGASQAGNSFAGIAVGNHTVTITDDNGCSYSIDFYISQPNLLILELTSRINVSCYGSSTGSAIVTAAGGTTGYIYSIVSGPNTPVVTGNVITGMVAGTYTVQVVDANSCMATLPVVISQPASGLNITSIAAVVTNPTCNGAATGSINTTVSGGTAPYKYVWSNGTNSAVPTGLSAGSYTVSVTDANGCTVTGGPYLLTNPPVVTLSASSIVSTTCGAATGSVVLTSSDGSSVTLNGVTKPSGSTFSGLIAGYFAPTSNGTCPATTTFRVNNSSSTLTATITRVNYPLCHNGTGNIIITGTGGTGTISYALDGGLSQLTGSFANVSAGNHTITVSDENNCIYTIGFNMINPPQLTLALTSQTNVQCNGLSTGSVIVAAAGGSSGYTYSLASEPPAGSSAVVTGNMISNMEVGNYTIRVTDANGCSADLAINISQPKAVTASAGNDAIICEAETYALVGSSATNAVSINWLSNGTGYFNNSSTLNPVYTPGASDISNGSVTLTLNVSQGVSCPSITSAVVLKISRKAVVNAGADAVINEDSIFTVSKAAVQFANSVMWTTNGLGTLQNPGTLTPTYKPALHETGLITLTLTAGSANPCGPITDQMILTIKHVNHPPVAVADKYEGKEFQTLEGNLLPNDLDIDGDHLRVDTKPVKAPAHGTLEMLPNGDFTYKPSIDFMGTDTFVYQVCDDGVPSMCASTTVTIVLSKDDSCPVYVPNSFSPNGDGTHDNFKVRCLYNYENPVIEIYNRWGNLVFKKDHYGNIDYWGSETEAWWNGWSDNKLTLGTKELPVGTYYYVLKLDKTKALTGFLFLNK
jgi:gliding motility-associated-like protein